MSLELHVFLSIPSLPTVEAWQAYCRSNDFEMELYSALNTAEHSGFVPCVFQGISTGFEYYLDDAKEIAETYPELSHDIGPYERVASFRWGANIDECAVAIMAACALAGLTDGLMYDPQDGALYHGSDALGYARTALDQITRFRS